MCMRLLQPVIRVSAKESFCSSQPTIGRMPFQRLQPLAMLSPVRYLAENDVHRERPRVSTMQWLLLMSRSIEMDSMPWSMSAHEDTWQVSTNGDRTVRRARATELIHMKCVKYVNRTLKLIN